jgi:hypothetical protein
MAKSRATSLLRHPAVVFAIEGSGAIWDSETGDQILQALAAMLPFQRR